MKKVAINGFGRIGRLIFKHLLDCEEIEIVAINDLSNIELLAHLLKYDSTYGNFKNKKVSVFENKIQIDKLSIEVFAEKDPSQLPWKHLNVDLVIESTGFFVDKEKAKAHIEAGAKKVIITAPAKGDLKTIVYNVNHNILDKNDVIISASSCTTNALALISKPLNDNFKILSAQMTTVHAVTNDQNLLDAPHKDFRRARAGINNIIPTTTGAASGIGKVIPELDKKMDGISLRVPVVVGSIVDLTFEISKEATIEQINNAIFKASNESLLYIDEPIVSTDIIGSSYGSIFDSKLTKKIEGSNLYKVFSWYDNESSYVNQLARLVKYFINL